MAATDVRPMYFTRGVDALKRVVAEGDFISARDAIKALEDPPRGQRGGSAPLVHRGRRGGEHSRAAAAARALGALREPRAVTLIKPLRYRYSNITDHQDAAAWALGQIEAVTESGLAATVLDALGARGARVGPGLLAKSHEI